MTALYLERYLNFGLTGEGAAGQEADHRHRPDRLRPLALQPPPSRARQARPRRHHGRRRRRLRVSVPSDPGDRQAPDRLPRPQPRLPLARRGALRLPARRRRAATGCDKTMPACLMAAATVNIPAISLNVGPMLNGWHQGERTGSGTIVWKARERHAAGDIDYQQFIDIVGSSAPSVGHCNTMGTASTMNALAEALGMSLPGSAAIPAPYRERGQMAYETGRRIVDMVWEDLKPSDIMTREAFENVIVANAAIGGSTNAPIHINAIAKHIGVPLDLRRLGAHRLRDPAPRQHAAGGRISRRGVFPRRRPARGDGRAHRGRQDPRERHHLQRQDHRRELPRQAHLGPRRDPPLRQAAAGEGGLPQPQGHACSIPRS